MESETRATGRATEEAESEFEGVVRLLGLSELETIAGSYSDLMINALADHRRQEGEPG
ncbi:MAG TPA: hypothetical protein VGR16_09130 [Thermomicrobiales bacterium]|nr:hypothetical protein [Thermomicrobiales bacterium]